LENLRELTSKKDLIAAEPRCQKRVQNAHEVDEPRPANDRSSYTRCRRTVVRRMGGG